jgi:hypothetical protein
MSCFASWIYLGSMAETNRATEPWTIRKNEIARNRYFPRLPNGIPPLLERLPARVVGIREMGVGVKLAPKFRIIKSSPAGPATVTGLTGNQSRKRERADSTYDGAFHGMIMPVCGPPARAEDASNKRNRPIATLLRRACARPPWKELSPTPPAFRSPEAL